MIFSLTLSCCAQIVMMLYYKWKLTGETRERWDKVCQCQQCVGAQSWHCLNWWDQHWQHIHCSWAWTCFITHQLTFVTMSHPLRPLQTCLKLSYLFTLSCTHPNACLFIVTKPINQNDIFHISGLFTLSGLRCSVLRHKVCDSIFMTTTTKVGMITFDAVWLGDASLGPCDLCIIHQSLALQQSQDCKLFTFIVGANEVWNWNRIKLFCQYLKPTRKQST